MDTTFILTAGKGANGNTRNLHLTFQENNLIYVKRLPSATVFPDLYHFSITSAEFRRLCKEHELPYFPGDRDKS